MSQNDVVVVATAATLDELIAQSNEQPLVLDVWAEWCGPCRMMAPIFAEVAAEHPEVTFAKLDLEAEGSRDAVAGYDIRGIPTFLIFKNGELADRVVGGAPKEKFWQALSGKLV